MKGKHGAIELDQLSYHQMPSACCVHLTACVKGFLCFHVPATQGGYGRL